MEENTSTSTQPTPFTTYKVTDFKFSVESQAQALKAAEFTIPWHMQGYSDLYKPKEDTAKFEFWKNICIYNGIRESLKERNRYGFVVVEDPNVLFFDSEDAKGPIHYMMKHPGSVYMCVGQESLFLYSPSLMLMYSATESSALLHSDMGMLFDSLEDCFFLDDQNNHRTWIKFPEYEGKFCTYQDYKNLNPKPFWGGRLKMKRLFFNVFLPKEKRVIQTSEESIDNQEFGWCVTFMLDTGMPCTQLQKFYFEQLNIVPDFEGIKEANDPEGTTPIVSVTGKSLIADINIIYTKELENKVFLTVPSFRMFGLNVLGIDAIFNGGILKILDEKNIDDHSCHPNLSFPVPPNNLMLATEQEYGKKKKVMEGFDKLGHAQKVYEKILEENKEKELSIQNLLKKNTRLESVISFISESEGEKIDEKMINKIKKVSEQNK